MCTPGAATSGFSTMSNRVGPFELHGASVSSLRCGVSCVSSAPTVSTYGLLPGDVISPNCGVPSSRLPVIARRRHHQHPRPRRPLDRLAQRIVPERLQHRRAERQVDDPDVVLLLVVDRPVDRLDHVAHRPGPIVAERPQVDEIRAVGDAARARCARRLARDDRRDVRPVAVAVHAVAAGEVHRLAARGC